MMSARVLFPMKLPFGFLNTDVSKQGMFAGEFEIVFQIEGSCSVEQIIQGGDYGGF